MNTLHFIKKALHLFLVTISLTHSIVLFGQTDIQHKKDSLINVIPQLEGQEKLKAYRQLCRPSLFGDDQADSLFYYFGQFINEAHKQNKPKEEAAARNSELMMLFNYNRRTEFIEKADACLQLCLKNDMLTHYFMTYQALLEVYFTERQYEKVLREANKMYEFAKKLNNTEGLGAALYTIALVYQKMDRYEEAERFYKETIESQKKVEMVNIVNDAYYGLCEVLSEQKKQEEALSLMKDWEKAVKKRDEQTGYHSNICWYGYYLINTRVYVEMGEFDKAKPYCDLAEKQLPDIGNALTNIYYYRSRISEHNKEYGKALEEVEKAYQYCMESEELPFSTDILMLKSRILLETGNSKDVYPIFETVIQRKDSIKNIEYNAQLDELRTIYEVDKHIAEKQKARLSFYFAAGIGALLLVILIIWFFYSRKIQKKNVALVDQILAQEKDQAEIDKLRKIARENAGAAHETDEIFAHLEKLMQEQQPYTETECNRKTLADAVGTNEKYLLESIKNNTGLPVSEYIMKYRLKHANTLLLRPAEEYTIDAVAIDSGFGSRSSFHEHYRANYGITPNEFRKTIQAKKE